MSNAQTVQPGDRVTLKSGRKVGTNESPGSCDLRGVKAVVVDDPSVRRGSVDGKVKERVHVRPVLPTGKLGMPLDVPVERIRDEDRRSSRSFAACATQAARDTWDRVFGKTKKTPTADDAVEE